MTNFELLRHFSMAQVSEEWDTLAPIRLKQILGGSDITFNHVLLPAIISQIFDEQTRDVLDAGCGVGVLTERLANYSKNVVGIDPSQKSIELAHDLYGDKIGFFWYSIEQFSASFKRRFDVIVANMVLMDAPSLSSFIDSAFSLTKPGGIFVFSITHPAFWPDYYGYATEAWYNYNEELIIRSPFRISSDQSCRINSTHIHRPINYYTDAITAAGFSIESIAEPMPPEGVAELYPKPWRFPRYALFKCRKRRFVK